MEMTMGRKLMLIPYLLLIATFVVFDLLKLPIVVMLLAPLWFIAALIDRLKGDKDWFKLWVEMIWESSCFTCDAISDYKKYISKEKV